MVNTSTFELDHSVARELLEAFSLRSESIGVRRISGGRSNENWLIDRGSAGGLVIQRSIRNNPFLEQCSIFANDLRAAEVNCVTYHSAYNKHVYRYAGQDFRLMPAMPGVAIASSPDDALVPNLWTIYEKISQTNCPAVGMLPPFESTEFFIDRLILKFKSLSNAGALCALNEALDAEFREIPNGLKTPPTERWWTLKPSHGDLNIRNFIVNDGEPCLIDFENCAFLPLWHDLGDIVRSWCSDKNQNLWFISTRKLELVALLISDFFSISGDEAIDLAVRSARMVTTKLCMHLATDFHERFYYSHNRNTDDSLLQSVAIIRSQMSLLNSLDRLS